MKLEKVLLIILLCVLLGLMAYYWRLRKFVPGNAALSSPAVAMVGPVAEEAS